MSKRLSSGQSNTILNYFQSPKASPKPKAPVEETNGKSPKIPKIADDDSDEEVISKTKKRKKIIDSESEDEGESVTKKTKGLEETPSRNIQGASSNGGTPKRSLKRFTLGDQSLNESRDNATCDEKDEVAPTENIKTSQISAPIIVDKHSNWLHNNLEFLKPERIRDINRNRPDHPDYDSRTLHVPKDFLDKQTPAMRQWWILKSAHMDSVLFFKVGKFYELYHMDAVVGVTQLGFSYMKGEFAHSGFPESAYHKMANALIEKGYKVARTEQTETPEMMSDRCKKQGKTTKFDKVVNREICQISTKATCVYNAQLPDAMHSLSCYLYAICEKDMTARTMRFGVCFIDTSIGTFNLTEFDDDKHCSKLLALLAEHPPGLILTERRRMSPKLKEVMSTFYKDTRKDTLASDSQFYSATKTVETLINRDYYRDENNQLKLPPFIKEITDGYDAKPGHDLELRSLGACLWYLEDSKLDIQVISMGKFEAYQPLNTAKRTEIAKKYMVLDSITMTNLNLLGSQCSLQQTIDSCCTAFGKRLLQQWICRPLCDVDKIKERQEASKELYEHPGLLKEAHDILRKLPDLERQVAKIHMYGNRFFAQDHPDSRAVFYESATYSKRRLNDLLKTLQAFERAQEIESVFSGCESSLLRTLTQFPPIGRYVDLKEPLGFFRDAFDQKQAQEEGKITPKRGVDDKFDQAEEAIEEIQRELDDYLKEQHQFFGCKVAYFGSEKKRFQIEVPENYTKKVTTEYTIEGSKKGSKPAKRYSTPQSRELLAKMLKAEGERAKIIQDLNRRIFEKFSSKHEEWNQAISCLTVFDVLCSFAQYARNFSQDICLPELQPFLDTHKIMIENGRHPCISNVDSYVPNDTKMGIEGHPQVLLITGPNMGGKSTLMRQVAIICIMAQMGTFVPASRCSLTLIDRIFTRLGAHDDIAQGQSTFLVELSEASAILQHATRHSLVLLDELGRGTSTHDGNAIATAYVQKLSDINCRTLFSTHYHSLLDYFVNREDIQLGHMACMVENDEDPTNESVTFLYKMAKGRCPKSYGFNVARLAGLKHCIVVRGREIAKDFENETKNRNIFSNLFSTEVADLRKVLASLNI